MRIDALPDAHLTYCTNIHPGERWTEVRHALETHVPVVKQLVAPDRSFGVGLRLGGAAAEDLALPRALEELRDLLRRHDLYVFTINGFPHGTFHGTGVKEAVYRPDWSERPRVSYTRRLIDLLAEILPEDVEGSISTVPGGFRPRASERGIMETMARNLLECAADLWRRTEAGGPIIALALEPEPHCILERIDETVTFFEEHLLGGPGFEDFLKTTGLGASEARDVLRRHLGVCLDTCHAAVEFEDPRGVVTTLRDAGIRIAKVQVTTGLRIAPATAARIEGLRDFSDRVYLHQTVAKTADGLRRFLDLPEAIEAHSRGELHAEQWRVHFHVPVFLEVLDRFENTQPFLRACLDAVVAEQATRHYEVETYTWDVLPAELHAVPVEEAIARELQWALERLNR